MNFLSDLAENLNHSTASAHEKGDQIIELLEHAVSRIGELLEAVTAETDQDEYFPITFQAQTDGAGAATVIVQRRPGFVTELVSWAAVGAAANAGMQIYLNDASPQNLIYAGTLQPFLSGAFPDGSVVPDGANLVLVLSAAGVTVPVNVTLRTRRKMLDRTNTRDIGQVGW